MRAFTLIELIIVIAIISILAALIVSGGRYVMSEADRKTTQTIQAITMQAIQVWFDNITPCQYPPGNGDAASPQELFDYLTGNADLNGDGSIDSADAQTSCVLAAREFLLKLPQAAFQRGDDCIRDGFGEPIRYSQFGGIGGRPVLISNGPDKEFGNEDNIRSDR